MSTEFVSTIKSYIVLRSTLFGTNWIKFYENKFYRIKVLHNFVSTGISSTILMLPQLTQSLPSVNILIIPPKLD